MPRLKLSIYVFNVGHIPGAIHIPVHKLLNEEFKALFAEKDTKKILYHSTQADACGPWMVLNMTGYKNVQILLGGYNYAKPNVIDSLKAATDTIGYRDEFARYDFALIGKASDVPTTQLASDNKQTAPVKMAPKKKKGMGGGC